jgi:hypothetical protein
MGDASFRKENTMTAFTITRIIGSPIDKVWTLGGNFTKAPGPGISVIVEKQGNPRSNGAGAERTITIGSVCVRERLLSVNAPQSFSYTILSGAPMKDHRAKADFIPRGSATEIRWAVEFTPKISGTGWIVCMVTKKAINRYIDEIEKAV